MAPGAKPMMARESGRRVTLLLLAQLLLATVSHGENFAAEVFSDDFVRIHSGLGENGASVLQFGDVVELIVSVEFDSKQIKVPELDQQFFESAWPEESSGIMLKDFDISYQRGRENQTKAMLAKYRFQVLACPDEQATCSGSRSYAIPEFRLQYQILGREKPDKEPVEVSFRVWPNSLTVLTNIARDDENQLLPFANYFPNGAYPEPLAVENSSGTWWVTAGTALAIFAGGMLMWPFGNRQKNKSASVPRWQSLLQELAGDEGQDEARLIDDLRRCLVWYCNDALQIDPFTWLDLAENGDQSEAVSDYPDLRALFVLLLHNPAGRGAELRTELQQLVSGAAAA